MEERQERRLIDDARAGDRTAFASLVDHYWGRLFRWLLRLTHHREVSEDLTQEALLRAWRGLDSFRPGTSFRAWLFGIARHALIDSRRGPRGQEPEPLPEQIGGRDPGPVQNALARESDDVLRRACDRLPEHYRSAFLLWSQEQLSFAEVGQVLDLPEATARWRVFKARLLLLSNLENYLDRKKP